MSSVLRKIESHKFKTDVQTKLNKKHKDLITLQIDSV